MRLQTKKTLLVAKVLGLCPVCCNSSAFLWSSDAKFVARWLFPFVGIFHSWHSSRKSDSLLCQRLIFPFVKSAWTVGISKSTKGAVAKQAKPSHESSVWVWFPHVLWPITFLIAFLNLIQCDILWRKFHSLVEKPDSSWLMPFVFSCVHHIAKADSIFITMVSMNGKLKCFIWKTLLSMWFAEKAFERVQCCLLTPLNDWTCLEQLNTLWNHPKGFLTLVNVCICLTASGVITDNKQTINGFQMINASLRVKTVSQTFPAPASKLWW